MVRLSRSQKAAPLHSMAQAWLVSSLTILREAASFGLYLNHRSVRLFSSSNSAFSTTGMALSVSQQTGWPLFSGAHLRPQSTLARLAL